MCTVADARDESVQWLSFARYVFTFTFEHIKQGGERMESGATVAVINNSLFQCSDKIELFQICVIQPFSITPERG